MGGGDFSSPVTEFGLYEFDQTKQIFTNYNRHFTITPEGEFSATSQTVEGWSRNAKTLYAYTPYNMAATSVTALNFTIPTNFTQDTENIEAHILANNLFVSTSYVAAGATAEALTFTPVTALLRFVLSNQTNSELTINGISYSNNKKAFKTQMSYNFREQSCLTDGEASLISVMLKEPITMAVGTELTILVPIVPTTLERDTEVTINVFNSREDIAITEIIETEGLTFDSGKVYKQEIAINEETYVKPTFITLPENQNSFIVTPAENGRETYLSLPVTRVNKYWGIINDKLENRIAEDTKWVAEIIWKDFDFNNQTLVLTKGGATGTGTRDKIGLTLFVNTEDQWGNAVVGIKKADNDGNPTGDYLWSWHIWVSDVTFNNTIIVNNDALMDRHLGAKSARKEDDVLAQGLLYQWGRKDPFIGTAKNWYNNGEKLKAADTDYTWPTPIKFTDAFTTALTNTQSYEAVDYAVNHPTTFIMRGNSWAWANNIEPPSSTWSYKLWLSGTKTIYDPCPQGWIIAKQTSFGSDKADVSLNIGINSNIGDWVWDDTYKGYSVNGVWFPAQKGLNGRTGDYGPDPSTANSSDIEDVTQNAFVVWTGQGSRLSSGYWGGFRCSLARCLYFTNDNVWHQLRGSCRANANPVRCIRYTAED